MKTLGRTEGMICCCLLLLLLWVVGCEVVGCGVVGCVGIGGGSGVGLLGTGYLFRDPLSPRGGNSRHFCLEGGGGASGVVGGVSGVGPLGAACSFRDRPSFRGGNPRNFVPEKCVLKRKTLALLSVAVAPRAVASAVSFSAVGACACLVGRVRVCG